MATLLMINPQPMNTMVAVNMGEGILGVDKAGTL
jgi:hypothetical protein